MDWHLISPFFSRLEVFSPETIEHGQHLIDVAALNKLNEFRRWLDKSLTCNNAYHGRRGVRSPAEQLAIEKEYTGLPHTKVAQLSMHVCGKAFDLSCSELSPAELADKALTFGWSGIGIYPTFVHVDMRTLWTPGSITWKV